MIARYHSAHSDASYFSVFLAGFFVLFCFVVIVVCVLIPGFIEIVLDPSELSLLSPLWYTQGT